LTYRTWSKYLPDSIEVYTANLPGRSNRFKEPAFYNLNTMVEAIDEAILPYLDKPFAIFGHSMGALISFELTRRLRANRNLLPAHLFISGRRAPHLPNTDPITYNLPDLELMEEVRRLNGTKEEVLDHPELIQIMLPLLRADFSVVETYAYKPDAVLNCPITVFGGLKDPEVTREQLEAWREQTSAGFMLRMIPGDHFFLYKAQPLLLRFILQGLQRLLST
jgi:medium-chain acyl-[acyl-carrier-protein] hydrolase